MGKVKSLLALVAVVAVVAACFTTLRTRRRLTPAPTRPRNNALSVGSAAEEGQSLAMRSQALQPSLAAQQLGDRGLADARRDMAESAAGASEAGPTPRALASAEFAAALEEADRLIVAGQPIAAHRVLSTLYRDRDLDDNQKSELLRRLDAVARDVFFAPGEPNLEPPYVLQPGELLIQVARKWNLSWQYLERLNGIDARRLRVGQRLTVVRGPFEAVVDLSDFELTVYLDGLWVRSYPVGTGRSDSTTPVGTFKVLDKVENPKYNGPEGNFAADDPKNPVGEHWIALGGGYGIHGTVEPQSIGKRESLGCIRMLPEDVEEVYHLLVRGSQVTIQR